MARATSAAAGLHTLCVAGGFFGGAGDGGQGEAVRVPLADGTLVALPDGADLSDDGLAAGLATLTDVMGTGHHGALASGAGPGDTAVVVGDGAVGLCAVLAARRLGRRSGSSCSAITRTASRSPGGSGPRTWCPSAATRRSSACASSPAAEPRTSSSASARRRPIATAIGCAAAGGAVGHVGSPVEAIDLRDAHVRNVRLAGGRAPVRRYIPELMADVLAGRLDPSPVMDLVLPLDAVPAGYEAMDARRAVKALIRTGAA